MRSTCATSIHMITHSALLHDNTQGSPSVHPRFRSMGPPHGLPRSSPLSTSSLRHNKSTRSAKTLSSPRRPRPPVACSYSPQRRAHRQDIPRVSFQSQAAFQMPLPCHQKASASVGQSSSSMSRFLQSRQVSVRTRKCPAWSSSRKGWLECRCSVCTPLVQIS